MSNRIRHYLKKEVMDIAPELHEAYRLIGKYQKNRSSRNEAQLEQFLSYIGGKLQIFKSHVQASKQPYFDAIVVSKMTRAEIILGIENVIGIVTDNGGSLCHAAIVSRKMGIPCIVGTKTATQVIKNNARISIDGSKGIVSKA